MTAQRKARSARALSRHCSSFGRSSAASFHRLRGFPNRRNDSRIGTAAADVAFHESCDFGLIWIRAFSKKREARHYHSRCAVTALKCLRFEERFLERVQ